MKRIAAVLGVFLLIGSPAAMAQSPGPAGPPVRSHVYAVIFELAADPAGKSLVSCKISKSIDPASGKEDPVNIDVPDAFVAGACEELAKKAEYPAGGKPFYTYFYFDPARPLKIDIDRP